MTVDELASGEEIKSLRKQRSQQYAFDKIHNSYSPLIINANQELERQMNKVKEIFLSKYSRIINQRIIEEKAKEQYLNTLISSLRKDIDYLNGKKNLLSNH